MGKSAFRRMVSSVLLLLSPSTLLAADFNAAMLYSNGPTWVNGAYVPRPSSSIFSGDLLQTRSDSVAKINEAGSTITVLSDSMVTFLGTSVDIEHGGVTVSTSKGVATTAGDVKVTPASFSWTEFNVVDVDGTVRILAHKGDLTITDGKEVFTLAQGQETTRSESAPDSDNNQKKNKKKQSGAAAPAAGGGILNSPLAIGVGAGIVGGITTWVLIKNDNPASPSVP
jgi:hypothetical protein